MSEIITAKEYAERVGVSGATVTRHIKEGSLHGVLAFYKVGNTWQLKLKKGFDAKEVRKNFRPVLK